LKLFDLIRDVEVDTTTGDLDVDVTSIAYDSRKVRDGGLFVAIKGYKQDGALYIDAAVNNGARVVVYEDYEGPFASGVTYLEVQDARRAMGRMAAALYGHPSRRMKVVGITGTNGKTTTSYLIKAGMEGCGHRAGVLGTISYQVGGAELPAPNTTPESVDMQHHLADMLEAGAEYAVVEVSSHSVSLKRTSGCEFSVRVFTNFTRDHLDFHGDMETYFGEKLKFFREPGGVCVVNMDDPRGLEVLEAAPGCFLTYGIDSKAAVRASDVELMPGGLRMKVTTPVGQAELTSPLVGRHNVYNILAAISACLCLDLHLGPAVKGIESLTGVPGRFERVDEGQEFTVFVDYAHTDDALGMSISAAREFTPGRLIVLFGCGGDRDRGKRPKMGEVAARGADVVVVTSDNPRSEDPDAIIRDVLAGVEEAGTKTLDVDLFVRPDREEAIRHAVGLARPGDTVLLAGKGHEDYQVIGDSKIHFDDREAARKALVDVLGTNN